MNTIFMLTLQQTATQGNAFMQFLPLILIVIVFWFFMIRPQMKRQKELKKYRDELKKGDKVDTGTARTLFRYDDKMHTHDGC